ncbi:MAG: DnaD domain protein [Streptococcaceae bacterium]|jgi:DNA replication protein|nr:DnaD domain protein [Streptococcaceae bacterium]
MKSLRAQMEDALIALPVSLFEYLGKLKMEADEFLLWLQIYRFHKTGDLFPSMKRLAELTNQSTTQVSEIIARLIQKELLALKSKKEAIGQLIDFYDPYLLFDRLEKICSVEKAENADQSAKKIGIAELNRQFQQEFGRVLTPIEIERLCMWLDQDKYDPELIQLALTEAVLANAYNFNYIDRILLTWEGKNIRTKADVLKEKEHRKKQLLQKEIDQKEAQKRVKNQPKVTIEKWL